MKGKKFKSNSLEVKTEVIRYSGVFISHSNEVFSEWNSVNKKCILGEICLAEKVFTWNVIDFYNFLRGKLSCIYHPLS